MSCWYFSNDEIEFKTPSREDGVPLLVESRYRRDGARFIINASNTLGLRYETPATGVVFFHRFFMIQSFKQFNRWVVAAACLLLAGKVEETPKKCKDVLKVTQSILTEHQMANFGSNPKEELLTHERILLQTIKFDLQVQHPYSHLLKFAKSLKGDRQKLEKLVETAWTFVNDSLSTVLCLQWEPQAIAVAFLYLAGKLAKFDFQGITQSKNRSWWKQFVDNLDVRDLDTICHQVLDTYTSETADSSTSQDEEEPEPRPHPPQQLPPSTASIPPSPSVIPSLGIVGGVGRTLSVHLPLVMPATVPAQGQSQLLTQLPQPHPSPHQMVRPPQVAALTNLQAAAASLSSVAVGGAMTPRPPAMPSPYQALQDALSRQGNIAIPAQPTFNATPTFTAMPTFSATHQGLSYSALNINMGSMGTTSLQPLSQPHAMLLLQQQQQQQQQQQLQQQQLQQLQQLQQQAQIQRGLAALPIRTVGSEITPPPAKRPAMELAYRPGLPQYVHQQQQQLPAGTPVRYVPQTITAYTPQQLTSQPSLFGSPLGLTLPPPPPPPPLAATQLRPVALPTMQGAATGYTARTGNTLPWQQK